MKRLFVPIIIIGILLSSCVATTQNREVKLPRAKQVQIAILKYEMARNIVYHRDYSRLAEAFKYLNEAKQVIPNDPRIYYVMALAYQLRGNSKEYAKYLRITIQKDKNFFDAYNALGVYYFEKGDYQKALKLFNMLINNPLYAHTDIAFFNRSRVYLKLHELKKAEDDVESALAFSNYTNKTYWKSLISIELELKEYMKALENLYKMEKYVGPSYYTFYTKAYCYYKLGMPLKAINELNKIRADNPRYLILRDKLLKKINSQKKDDNNTND